MEVERHKKYVDRTSDFVNYGKCVRDIVEQYNGEKASFQISMIKNKLRDAVKEVVGEYYYNPVSQGDKIYYSKEQHNAIVNSEEINESIREIVNFPMNVDGDPMVTVKSNFEKGHNIHKEGNDAVNIYYKGTKMRETFFPINGCFRDRYYNKPAINMRYSLAEWLSKASREIPIYAGYGDVLSLLSGVIERNYESIICGNWHIKDFKQKIIHISAIDSADIGVLPDLFSD